MSNQHQSRCAVCHQPRQAGERCQFCGDDAVEKRPSTFADSTSESSTSNPINSSINEPANAPVLFVDAKLSDAELPKKSYFPNPDQPKWGLFTGFGIWLLSVALIIGAPLAATVVWLVWKKIHHQSGDTGNLLSDSNFLALFSIATGIAQLLTLAVAYLILRWRGAGDFWQSLGWRWHSVLGPGRTFLLTIAVFLIAGIVGNKLPNKESDLEKLLNVGLSVRIYIAVLAVLTAPLVEEIVYRGVLFAPLRKKLGRWPAIIIVALMFVGVHVPQYWGAWGVIAALTILSFTLTTIRGLTSTILPCYTMHLIFNSIQAIAIVATGYKK